MGYKMRLIQDQMASQACIPRLWLYDKNLSQCRRGISYYFRRQLFFSLHCIASLLNFWKDTALSFLDPGLRFIDLDLVTMLTCSYPHLILLIARGLHFCCLWVYHRGSQESKNASSRCETSSGIPWILKKNRSFLAFLNSYLSPKTSKKKNYDSFIFGI